MAGFSMNRVLGTIKKRPTFGSSSSNDAHAPVDLANGPPEVVAARCVKQFCQSSGTSAGDDVIYLPSIVEAAVASPAAAEECARLIRKYMHRDFWTKPSCQYNAIMVARILADNPGPGFTRFVDKKFVDAAKELLRTGRDPSVRQILMETLDAFESSKADDPGLALIIQMWKKEKAKAYQTYGGSPAEPVMRPLHPSPFNPYQPHPAPYYPQRQHSKRLPDPVELANRLEEARTSAKLLEQVVACTPASEMLSNELIKEFADRCTSAARSVQAYMAADAPAPDNDTMESLIDTNEQLQHALNLHQRAVLHARKQFGPGSGAASPARSGQPQPQPQPPTQAQGPPLLPTRKAVGSGSSNGGGPSRSATGTPRNEPSNNGNDNYYDSDDDDDNQDPFRDPPTERAHQQRLSFEPFHPGFGGGGSGSGSGSGSGAGVGAGAGSVLSSGFGPGSVLGSGSGSGLRKQAASDKGRAEPVTPVSEDEGGSDLYRATPGKEYRV